MRTATGNAQGNYRLTVPSAGNYIIRIRQVGYTPLTRDNLSIGGGGSSNIDFSLTQSVIQLDVVVTAASRAPEKIIDAPASVSVAVSTAAVAERAAVNIADHVVAQPCVDVARGGIARSNIVARGFNNIFSGSLLTLTDNRFAFVPSLRVNIPYLTTTPNEDINHQIVLGPRMDCTGPNTAGGVMSVTTKSPFASPGTTVTIDGGNQSLIRGGFRAAWALNQKFGVKASYDVFHGRELPCSV